MNNFSIIFILVLTSVFNAYLAQLNSVPIKSHKVITTGINSNQLQSIYDNNADTIGSFYSAMTKDVEIEFDLEKNYLIQHVLIRMKKEKNVHRLSLSVGNKFEGQGGLPYVCELMGDTDEIYKCQPDCRSKDNLRSGIIARKFVMKLQIPSQWISVYEMEVFSSPVLVTDDISSNRLVLPLTCQNQAWLLTDKISPVNKSIVTTENTSIVFEKPYILTEIVVEFQNTSPNFLEFVLRSGDRGNLPMKLSLSDCMLQKSLFTCPITEKTFSSRLIEFQTTGLIKIFIKGKPVFYPQLKLKTSTNVKERLQMHCEYNQCDLSVHSDCSPETIKAGVKFDCVNKQLIRMPSASDQNSYVIVNRGKVESALESTKFAVDTDNEDRMIVSMPRSHQYFGQYRCACIVSDKMSTVIKSETSQLKDTDFLKDLIFENVVEYKLSDVDDAAFDNVSNNVILVSKSKMASNFMPAKLTMYSLIPGVNISIAYPVSDTSFDQTNTDRSIPHSVQAFKNIPQSWSVATHKYVIDEIFPEFIHGSGLSLSCQSLNYKRQQNIFVRMLDEDKVKETPSIWSSDDGANAIQINMMYANQNESTLYHIEKNCIDTNTSVLAKFSKSGCMSKDTRLTCSKFGNSTLVTFKDERNFAKNILINLKENATNKTIADFAVKGNITLNQDDVTIKTLYKRLSSASAHNVLKLSLEIVSKKISDFIPCGNVNVNISMGGQLTKQMIVQKPTFEFDVTMTSSVVMVTIKIFIDKVIGVHETVLQITDPTTFNVSNVELQQDQTLNLLWHGINDIARDCLQSYDIKITTSIPACMRNTTETKSINESQTVGAKNRYQVPMAVVNEKHVSTMEVTVQSMFKGNKTGRAITVRKVFGSIGQTKVIAAKSKSGEIKTREQTIAVLPSQSDLGCDINKVEFEVSSITVEKLQWKSVSLGNNEYKITGLIPGRSYQLKAKVVYKNGQADKQSEIFQFETPDDISVLRQDIPAQLNQFLNVTCTADIGPEDKFKKSVEWLRADRSLLPDGVKSIKSVDNPRVAILVIEKALADYSGEYGCFAKPSSSSGFAKITITVNDLVVNPVEEEINFMKPKTVSVTCSTSAGGNNNLIWLDPQGEVISESKSSQYSITKMTSEQKVHMTTLKIKDVSLSNTGVYKCHKSIDNANASKQFLLYGKESLTIKELPQSSNYIGEKLRLRCSAVPALSTQKVMWENVQLNGDSKQLMETSYPNATDNTIQDLSLINTMSVSHVKCKLVPSLKDEATSQMHKIVLKSKIVVSGPTEVKEGNNAKLTCVVSPNAPNTKVEWIFYPETANTTGKIVKESPNKPDHKSYEPIQLDLDLFKANPNKTGRYECKLKQETRGASERFGKSVSLVIKPASSSAVSMPDTKSNTNPKNAAQATLQNSFLTVLITFVALVSFTVNRCS